MGRSATDPGSARAATGYSALTTVGHTELMTARDRLHELVDLLDDEAAERLLEAAQALVPAQRSAPQGDVPAFVGSFASGHADVSERGEEILRDELGGQRES